MNLLASLLLAVVIGMSPAARDAFGKIVKAEIVSGIITLQDQAQARIEAVGIQNGIRFKFNCIWSCGWPVLITKYAEAGEL